MKKTMLAIFLLGSLTVQAQLSKGNRQIGGNINLSVTSKDDALFHLYAVTYPAEKKATTIHVSPSMGFFISDNMVFGGNVSFLSSTEKNTVDYADFDLVHEESNNIIAIGPYFRAYKPLGESAALFLQANVTVGFGKSHSELEYDFTNIETDGKLTLIDIGLRPGFTFFLSKNWAIEGMFGVLGYSNLTKTLDDESVADSGEKKEQSTEKFDLNLRLSSFSIGIQYFLSKE